MKKKVKKEELPPFPLPFGGIDQENLVAFDDLEDLFQDDVEEEELHQTSLLDGLNEDQAAMVTSAMEYIKTNKEERDYFLIQGSSGSGKTFAIARLIDHLHGYSVVAAAPSHFAKNILSSFMSKFNITVYTVAALMGKKLTFNDKGEHILVDKPGRSRPPIMAADIVIIDEVSMIADDTTRELLRMCRGKKIIFLGDYAQLPPVKQDTDNIAFKNISARLVKPMRFAGPIYELASIVRKEINKARSGKFADIRTITMNTKRKSVVGDDGSGYIFLNDFAPFINAAIKRFKEKKGTKYVRVLAYRNKTIATLNNIIRKALYGPTAKQFEDGELVICNGGYKQELSNGEVLIVKSTKKITGKYGIECLSMRFEGTNVVVPVVATAGKEKYKDQLAMLKLQAYKISSKWSEYFAFKESFAYFDYSYSSSTHKAQGSSISNIFIMEEDILAIKPISIKEKLQSLYVAITRASFRVFIYNKNMPADQSELNREYLLLREKDDEKG